MTSLLSAPNVVTSIRIQEMHVTIYFGIFIFCLIYKNLNVRI
jgi:hypothetical protein